MGFDGWPVGLRGRVAVLEEEDRNSIVVAHGNSFGQCAMVVA